MREILFRGKRADNEKWEYGLLVKEVDLDGHDELCIQTWRRDNEGVSSRVLSVIPGTVSQYTGVTDKNGTKIFEGDVVKNDWCFDYRYSVVKFGEYKTLDMSDKYQQGHLGFYLEHIHEKDKRSMRKDIIYFANNCEVIGNIHDNPELLEGACEQ